ncbi:MAG TPA: hypothetical protein VE954_08850 [Oligoflexus sp.]|uniref:hypothetical protein n=1 Tax=Oligoflexus sp. TaxID=1971216 RepID=UPI002D47F9A2|nr:hypothetical protein [Oligoflexus sp.]HYX33211.1 hypothetical protein [Oligoflexus sp.]
MKQPWLKVLFWMGLVLKLSLIPTTDSYFVRDLFIPFIDKAIETGSLNPWLHKEPHQFPYGAVLFVVLAWPKALFFKLGFSALGTGALGLFLFKFPLLLVDLAVYFSVKRKFEVEPSRWLGFYWLNPILIYVAYVAGHIDLVPMAFITFACFALCRGQVLLAGLWAGLSVASKFHTALAFPLLFLFIWRNTFWPQAFWDLSKFACVSALVGLAGFYLPYVAGNLGYVTLTSPEAMRLFAFAIPLSNENHLYVGFVFVLVVLGRLLVSQKLTEQGLFFGLGIVFNALLLATDPMFSWYLWLMPFSAVFVTQFSLVHWILPVLQMAFYFIYFVGFDPLRQVPSFLSGVAFTLVQTSIAANLVLMWYFVRREFPLSSRLRPVIIGIAGDSGAGKSRLSEALSQVFDVRKASFVEGDDYHRWERGHQNFQIFTHLSPRANFLSKLSFHTRELALGQTVSQPHYDHQTGMFTPPRVYKPSQTIIIQGLHTLYPKDMREAMDLKVFINPHPAIRMAWKIKRDVQERSYSLEKVVNALNSRKSDGKQYIEPQMYYADWIVEAHPIRNITEKDVIDGMVPDIKMRHILWNDALLEELYEALEGVEGLEVAYESLPENIDRVFLEVSGSISAFDVARIAVQVFPSLKSLTRAKFLPKWLAGFDGINQLLALSLLQRMEARGFGK